MPRTTVAGSAVFTLMLCPSNPIRFSPESSCIASVRVFASAASLALFFPVSLTGCANRRVPNRSSAPESTVSLSCLLYFAQSFKNSAFVVSSCSVEAK